MFQAGSPRSVRDRAALRDVLRELVAKGNKKFSLQNLGDVSYIDELGDWRIGFRLHDGRESGRLIEKLLSLTKRVKDLLQITKLYTVFDVHEDEAHAVKSFA